jgi:hypothetical protein
MECTFVGRLALLWLLALSRVPSKIDASVVARAENTISFRPSMSAIGRYSPLWAGVVHEIQGEGPPGSYTRY